MNLPVLLAARCRSGIARGAFVAAVGFLPLITTSRANIAGAHVATSITPADNHNVVAGSGTIVGSDIRHPNGNIYDQVLLTGPSVTVAADPGQVIRTSFIDDNDDITQVEFSGSGTVTIMINSATYQPPAPPLKYIQPGVTYVKGHATVRIQNAAADTNVAIFSVGRGNAVNQALFPAGMTYDGMADIELLRIDGPQLGAIYAGNVRFTSAAGATGIYAPFTDVLHRISIGDIGASATAAPLLQLGGGSTLDQDAGAVRIAGGALHQLNNAPIDVSLSSGDPFSRFVAVDGGLSSGTIVPASSISAHFTSLIPGTVTINGSAFPTQPLLAASFSDLLAEAGLSFIDFGGSISFSGGNTGTYTVTINTSVNGIAVNGTLSGTYSYAVGGPYENQLTFSMNFSRLSIAFTGGSFSGDMFQFATLAATPVPTRITTVATLDSSVSGTATTTVRFTNSQSLDFSDNFDLDHTLYLGLF